MIGDLKLSDLIPKDQWDNSPVPTRVQSCKARGLDGTVGSKSWGELTIQEALILAGKLNKPYAWQDPFMTHADFEQARRNREGYTPKRPDGMEETDESRERRRAERRAERPARVVQAKKQPVWDPVAMRMTYQ